MGIIRQDGRTLKKETTPVERNTTSIVALQNQINNITKEEFTATADQTEFVCQQELVLPILFYNGSIQGSENYSFSGFTLTLNEGVEVDAVIQIINLR
jgi:hypothetical protein